MESSGRSTSLFLRLCGSTFPRRSLNPDHHHAMTDSPPKPPKDRVQPATQISPVEHFWKEHQPWLKEQGYELRPRYEPNWTPSWVLDPYINGFKQGDHLTLEVSFVIVCLFYPSSNNSRRALTRAASQTTPKSTLNGFLESLRKMKSKSQSSFSPRTP